MDIVKFERAAAVDLSQGDPGENNRTTLCPIWSSWLNAGDVTRVDLIIPLTADGPKELAIIPSFWKQHFYLTGCTDLWQLWFCLCALFITAMRRFWFERKVVMDVDVHKMHGMLPVNKWKKVRTVCWSFCDFISVCPRWQFSHKYFLLLGCVHKHR